MKGEGTADLLRRVRGLYEGGGVVGLSDAELLRRFAGRGEAGDGEAAFEALVTRHGPMVLGVCRRALGDAAEAEDAFQATFLVLVRRAPSVRVDDSLGRWLHGVATRVARKAAARPRRPAPMTTEPEAPTEPDRTESLAALDEELRRLPEKYRSPILLCHLEGLSHAEAADRLRWPVGTLSGRLTRARGLLKERLERRGVGGPADALAAVPWRVALADGLAHATARAAAGSAGRSAAATALAATAGAGWSTAPRIAAAILLAAAGVLVVPGSGRAPIPGRDGPAPAAMAPSRAGGSSDAPPPHFRTAQAIVDDIEERLLVLRSPRKQLEYQRERNDREPFRRADREIPGLVLELRTAYPDDPRGSGYMLERWISLQRSGRAAEARDEAAGFVGSADAGLARDARYYLATADLSVAPVDGPRAVAVARDAARGLGDDPRVGGLLYAASEHLESDVRTRIALLAILGLATAVASIPRCWRRAAGVASLWAGGVLVFVVVAARSLAGEWFDATIDYWYRVATSHQRWEWWKFVAGSYLSLLGTRARVFLAGPRCWMALAAAVAAATLAVAPSRRRADGPPPARATAGLAARWFVATLAAALAVDAASLEVRRRMLLREVVRDHPDSLRGRLVQGRDRRIAAIGRPFELEFDDAITGRHVAMKDLRGKVVVVDFWATWCGPCVGEIPEMRDLYETYRARGVEFIGVSLDNPEEYGGLEDLREFVAERGISWPQYFQGAAFGDPRTGAATGSFSESWGVDSVPTVFVVDAEGRLYSTDARGKLGSLIPKLLDARDESRR